MCRETHRDVIFTADVCMSLMYSLVVRMDVKDLGVSPVYNPGGGMEKPEATLPMGAVYNIQAMHY
jgi:hypothetical protein